MTHGYQTQPRKPWKFSKSIRHGVVSAIGLLRLGGSIGLGPQVGRGRAALEETTEDGLEEGVENELGTVGLGKRHPEDQDELEDVVEGEPVSGADGTLNDGQESVDNPVRQPLSVIGGTGSEESLKRVVTGNQETGKVDEELASDVEENQEEVDANQTQDRIDLGDVGLALQVVKNGVLRELLVELRNGVLGTVLDGSHYGR